MKKIVAFSGSNSLNSINQSLIIAASKLHNNVEFEIISLRDFRAPIYSIDTEMENGMPAKMEALSSLISQADALLISTPEHNGATTTVMKNTIDWLSRIEQKLYQNKPVVFLSTSPGPRGGSGALSYFTNAAPYQGAKVVGSRAIGSFQNHVINNAFVDGEEKQKVSTLLKSLVAKL